MLVTTQCASYCRYCTRSPDRRRRHARTSTARSTRPSSTTCAARPQVRDVLISGGDGLTLAPKLLESILRGLREIPHIEIVRIGSRVPVFLPQRIDDELCEMLAKYHPLWMNLHFNHPNEITPEVAPRGRQADPRRHPARQPVGAAGRRQRLRAHPARAGPQAGREPDPAVLPLPVRPGRGRRATSGRRSARASRSWRACAATPPATPSRPYVVDAPGGGGKIPVMPNYLISYSDHKVVLRNYEGYITTYEEPPTYTPHDTANCRVLPEPAPGAGPGAACTALLDGQADVDRAGRLRRDRTRAATSEAHRLQDPSQVGAVRRRRDRGPVRGAAPGPAERRHRGTRRRGGRSGQARVRARRGAAAARRRADRIRARGAALSRSRRAQPTGTCSDANAGGTGLVGQDLGVA